MPVCVLLAVVDAVIELLAVAEPVIELLGVSESGVDDAVCDSCVPEAELLIEGVSELDAEAVDLLLPVVDPLWVDVPVSVLDDVPERELVSVEDSVDAPVCEPVLELVTLADTLTECVACFDAVMLVVPVSEWLRDVVPVEVPVFVPDEVPVFVPDAVPVLVLDPVPETVALGAPPLLLVRESVGVCVALAVAVAVPELLRVSVDVVVVLLESVCVIVAVPLPLIVAVPLPVAVGSSVHTCTATSSPATRTLSVQSNCR